jgi:hypothetical protein
MPLKYTGLPQAFIVIGVVYAAATLTLALQLSKTEKTALRKAAIVGILRLVATMVMVNI